MTFGGPMRAPRLPSPFRNVRQAPRNFTFRSSHVDARDMKWKERKAAIEAEVRGEDEAKGSRKLRFRSEGGLRVERQGRLAALRRARKRAMLRSTAILLVLLYAAWRGLKWVETTDFAREFLIPANG